MRLVARLPNYLPDCKEAGPLHMRQRGRVKRRPPSPGGSAANPSDASAKRRIAPMERDSVNGAEGEGFEPSSDPKARNGFRDRRIRPLCHPSGVRNRVAGYPFSVLACRWVGVGEEDSASKHGLFAAARTEKEGFEPSMEVSTPITP